MELLGHSQRTAERIAAMVEQLPESDLGVVAAAAPLLRGSSDNAGWSVRAAVDARRVGKPVTLLWMPRSGRTEIELYTGKVKLMLEAG